ncbi:MAG TPA: alpha/beta family hydrolase [Candidatus Binatia bacterium]|nr:alpha/beta family hydrolase [Candidatus Binatia bacterium]
MDEPGRPAVRGHLHRADSPTGVGLVLTHGAGGDSRTPLLVAVARAAAAAGIHVLRCDLPYRQARASGPPSPSGAPRDRAGLDAAAAALRRMGAVRLVLGGLSYGGRQATLLAAEEPGVAEGLLLLSYPLHPPGRPADLRTAHWPQLRAPGVFVHGARDPFGSPEEMRQALALIPARTALIVVDGAGHDLSRSRRAAAETHREVAAAALAALRDVAKVDILMGGPS